MNKGNLIDSQTQVREGNEQLRKEQARNTMIIVAIIAVVFGSIGLNYFLKNSNLQYIEGNILKIARTGSASTGNIWKNDSFVSQLAWSSLFVTDPGFTEVNPGLAEKYELSSDGLTYTITMKDNLKWSDGNPLTAEDVVWSIECYLLNTGTNNTVTTALNQIKGADEWQEVGLTSWENGGTHNLEGISYNGNVITIELADPYATFSLTLTQFVPLPKHILNSTDPSTFVSGLQFFIDPVCSGMYKVDCLNGDGDLELIHNEHFYGDHSDIERVILFGDYNNMHISHYSTTNITEMVSYRSMPGFLEYNVNSEFYRYFVFNMMADYRLPDMVEQLDDNGKPVLDSDGEPVLIENPEPNEYSDEREINQYTSNLLVRQAMNHAIDRETLLKDVYLGAGKLSSNGVGSDGSVNFYYPYDPAKARALLEEAQYDFDRPYTIGYYHNDTNTQAFLSKVQVYLEDIGLTVRLVRLSGSDAIYNLREYDMLLKALSAFNTEDWYNEYLNSNETMHNLVGTHDFDDLMKELAGTTTQEDYDKVIEKLRILDRDTCYKVPLFTLNDMVYINGNRVGVPDDLEFGNSRFRSELRLSEWYIKKE